MSKMLKFLAVALVLFSLAAGGSWYLQIRQSAEEENPKTAEDKSSKPGAASAHGKASGSDAAAARPLVRPPLSPEAERFTQMASTLQSQQEALRKREELVAAREKQMDLVHEEIKKDQRKVEAARKEVDTELKLVQEKLELLETKTAERENDRGKSEAQLEEIRQKTLELNGVESKNLKQVALIYDKMDPEAASQSIQQMVEKGKLDTAVTILVNMRDRQAANLLGEISKQDASIAAQLFDRMRFMKAPANAQK